jgi:cytochrome c553
MKKSIKREKMMYRSIAISTILIWMLTSCGQTEEHQKLQDSKTVVEQGDIKVTEGVVEKSVKETQSKKNSGKFYYSYNKENNNSTDETQNRRTTIDAYLNIKSPYERVRITMMIKRLSKEYIIKCSPCHNDYANGVIGPSLLDKDGDFIYKRITAFKSGERKNPLMKELVSQMDDEKLKEIADEIANFNKEIRKLRRGK